MAQPSLLREELRRAWRELRGSSLSPARGAAAVALGLFIGSHPTPGLHTPLVLALCLWLRLDAAIAWVASNISNPLFFPFLVAAEVQVGAYLWTGGPVAFDVEMARQAGMVGFLTYASDFAGYAFLGAPFVGLGLALVGAALVYGSMAARRRFAPFAPRVSYRLPADAPPWWHAAERVAWRYAPDYETEPVQRGRFHYVRVKLLGDPICRMVADLEGDEAGVLGSVFDVGTGRGQVPIMLLELGRATSAQGVDWDEGKIAEAQKAAANEGEGGPLPATFEQADVREAAIESSDTVLLLDIVHYLAVDEQDQLLERAARAVGPGGRLVIREADTARGWRSWMTLAEELIFTAIRFNRGARVRFRASGDIVRVLEGEGLDCEVRPAWGRTPFSNVLILGRRPIPGDQGP